MNRRNENGVTPLRHVFGRVIQHPDCHNGKPFLNGTCVTVPEILADIENGLSDSEITDKYEDINKLHIRICRAYQARFEAHTQTDLEHVDPDDKVFMLDENISYTLLYDVAREYGWCSHVYADGLYGDTNDDLLNIWAHMVQQGYKAILTQDSDFKRISRNYRRGLLERYGALEDCSDHIPVVVFVSKSLSLDKIIEKLRTHKSDILGLIDDNNAAFASLNGSGFTKHAKDKDTIAEIEEQRALTSRLTPPQRRSSASPS